MRIMKYDFDAVCFWSSLDLEVSAFKPNAKFLKYFQEIFHYKKSEILFVGDRIDRDKALADNFGCQFVHIKAFNRYAKYLVLDKK